MVGYLIWRPPGRPEKSMSSHQEREKKHRILLQHVPKSLCNGRQVNSGLDGDPCRQQELFRQYNAHDQHYSECERIVLGIRRCVQRAHMRHLRDREDHRQPQSLEDGGDPASCGSRATRSIYPQCVHTQIRRDLPLGGASNPAVLPVNVVVAIGLQRLWSRCSYFFLNELVPHAIKLIAIRGCRLH